MSSDEILGDKDRRGINYSLAEMDIRGSQVSSKIRIRMSFFWAGALLLFRNDAN